MAAFLVADAQIVAGPPPFLAVRENPFSAGTKLGEEMCQLMQKRSANLLIAMFGQQQIERDQF